MQTVAELFRCLEREQIVYAVLRNYETLPDLRGGDPSRNTDIDLVVESRELPRVRALIAGLAARLGWDALTECDHFGRSPARHHNIEIFQFYRFDPLEYLQIDVFHGYLAWGLPLMDEREMLEGRVHDRERALTHIDPLKENTFRLIQIHGLGSSSRTAEKRVRYRAKIEDLCRQREGEYLAFVRERLGPWGVEAVRALRAADTARYLRSIPRAKAYFFLRYFLRHPLAAMWQVAERFRENRQRFHGDPCGCVLAVHAPERARAHFEIAMDTLLRLNVLDEWTAEPGATDSGRSGEILEQGGIVVRWTDRESASVVIGEQDDPDRICVKVLSVYVRRHRTLYSAANPQPIERALSVVPA